ncbi:MAG: cob(I)yrinic acid a,c-diamide adenosyltransferase [Sphaerochaetaceae bacterium]
MLQPNSIKRHPLLIVYTGDGKGKTTSAMGLVFRTLGHEGKVFVIQFLKSESLKTGEKKMAKRLGVGWENYGTGFLKTEQDFIKAKEIIEKGWQRAKELITANKYDLIILDEFTHSLKNNLISTEQALSFFKSLKGDEQVPHIVITGRDAPKQLIEIADLVSSVEVIKHPYIESKLLAQKMIEF